MFVLSVFEWPLKTGFTVGIECVVSESCQKGTILQRNYSKKTLFMVEL